MAAVITAIPIVVVIRTERRGVPVRQRGVGTATGTAILSVNTDLAETATMMVTMTTIPVDAITTILSLVLSRVLIPDLLVIRTAGVTISNVIKLPFLLVDARKGQC